MKGKSESEVTQSCPTLIDPMDCSLPGSSVHGIFQARVLEWDAIAFSEQAIYLPPKVLFPLCTLAMGKYQPALLSSLLEYLSFCRYMLRCLVQVFKYPVNAVDTQS